MYGRSSINSVAGSGSGSGEGGDGGARDMGGRAQSLVSSGGGTSSSSVGGCSDSSTSSSTSSLVESGPRSSRDVRRSISSCNQKTGNGGSCSSVDSRIAAGPRILGNPSSSELYDQNILKNRASVLSQLSSVFGQRSNNSSRSNSLVQQRQVKKTKSGTLEQNRISPQV